MRSVEPLTTAKLGAKEDRTAITQPLLSRESFQVTRLTSADQILPTNEACYVAQPDPSSATLWKLSIAEGRDSHNTKSSHDGATVTITQKQPFQQRISTSRLKSQE